MTHRDRKATIISAAIALLGMALVFGISPISVGEQDDRTGYSVTIPHDAVGGLKSGMAVEMLGRQIGQVDSIGYAEDGSGVELMISMAPGQQDEIVVASRVSIDRSAGGPHLEIVRDGKASQQAGGDQLLRSGSSIPFAKPDPVKNASPQSIFTTIARLLPNVMKGFGEATDFMTYMAADTDTLMTEVSDLVNVDGKQVLGDLKEITTSLKSIVAVLEAEVQQAPGTMHDVRQLLNDTQQVVQQADCLLYQSGEMVDAIRNRPLVRRMVGRNQRRRCR
jgi:ABC-type transporter Mla subunit MlaD